MMLAKSGDSQGRFCRGDRKLEDAGQDFGRGNKYVHSSEGTKK